MSGYETVWLNKSASRWVDTPVKVVWGIQLNPAYLDGVDTDREGNELTIPQQTALESYRRVQRTEWRNNNDNIIGERV